MPKYCSPDRYVDDSPKGERPGRTEYHAQQEVAAGSSPRAVGKPSGVETADGTANLRATANTKQASVPTSAKGEKNKWPSRVDSYQDGEV